MNDADWIGKLEKRWSWRRCRMEWGRWCYKTDCSGETTSKWWEWEKV